MRSGWMRRLVLAFPVALALATPVLAQGQGAGQGAGRDGGQGGGASREVAPATPPAQGRGDATAPGNSGSTGWSGGTGGSFIGTTNSGRTSDSRTWQPPVARGLDPFAAPKRGS